MHDRHNAMTMAHWPSASGAENGQTPRKRTQDLMIPTPTLFVIAMDTTIYLTMFSNGHQLLVCLTVYNTIPTFNDPQKEAF